MLEYQVFRSNPEDAFEKYGEVLIETNDLALAFTITDMLWKRFPHNAYGIYQPHHEYFRGGSGFKDEDEELPVWTDAESEWSGK